MGFLIGQVMQASGGKANPKIIGNCLRSNWKQNDNFTVCPFKVFLQSQFRQSSYTKASMSSALLAGNFT